jgi:MarR family transcriptional regulator for hemolysin
MTTRLTHDFEESIGYLICLTNRAFQRAVNEELKRLGVTFQQFQVLAWLALEGDLTQSGLAERLEVEGATLVGILDRMERDGWIVRCPDPKDRRKNWIRPTTQVEPTWNRMVRCLRLVRRRAVTGLSPEQVQQLRHLLGRVQENLRLPDKPAGRSRSTPTPASSR